MVTLSVIIPVYNCESYLNQCLDSIQKQTFRDLEVICVDDGSTDGSGAICDSYAAQDSRFVVIHQKNGGQSAARNKGLDNASGRFITFVDGDDYLETSAYETVLACFTSDDTDMVQFKFQMFNEKKYIPREQKFKAINLDFDDRVSCVSAGLYVVWNKIYRREFLQKHNIRFLEGYNFEDVPFTHLCAFCAHRIDACPKILYNYRIGSGYSTRKETPVNKIELIRIYQATFDSMRRCNVTENQLELYEYEKLSSFRTVYRRYISRSDRSEARKMILASLSDWDWDQIAGHNPRLSPRKRAFFYWLAGNNLKAFGLNLLSIFSYKKR